MIDPQVLDTWSKLENQSWFESTHETYESKSNCCRWMRHCTPLSPKYSWGMILERNFGKNSSGSFETVKPMGSRLSERKRVNRKKREWITKKLKTPRTVEHQISKLSTRSILTSILHTVRMNFKRLQYLFRQSIRITFIAKTCSIIISVISTF